MASSFLIPKNVRKYLRRIISEYERGDKQEIAQIVQQGTPLLREDSNEEAWDDSHGHELILLLSEGWMKQIPLSDQGSIEERLRDDLNSAAKSISDEYFWNVRFDYKDGREESGSSDLIHTRNAKDEERIWASKPIRLFISHRDSVKTQVLVLTRFRGHLNLTMQGVHDAKDKKTLPTGVSRANGRAGSSGPYARGVVAGVRADSPVDHQLGGAS